MLLQFSPIIVLYLVAALINLILARTTWYQHKQPGSGLWALVLLCAVLWAVGSTLQMVVADPIWMLSMARFTHICIMGIVYFWGLFALRYSNHNEWLTLRFKILTAIVPVVSYLIFLFDRGNWFYATSYYTGEGGLFLLRMEPRLLAWVWAIYGYGVLIISLVVVVRSVWRTPNLYRMQAVLITLAVLLPMTSNFAQFSGLIPDYIDLTPVVFMAAGILMLIAAQRFEFLRLVPVAYDTIYHSINNGIVIVNTDWRIVRMNPSAESILGTTQSATVGQSLQILFPAQYEVIMRTTYEQPTMIELKLGNPVRTYELQANTLSNQSMLMGYIIMLADITERKIASEEHSRLLLEEERTRILTTFIAKAAHEFRTPLSVIKSGEYLIGKSSELEKIRSIATQNTIQVDAISHLVDNLLLMTRVDNRQVAFNLQKLDWNECVQTVVETQRASAAGRGITLIYEADQTHPVALIDDEMMANALRELLDNAIRYSPNDSTVRIVCSTPHCTVKFIDEGIGIGESDQPHIFEQFYRVDASHNTRGFGLGLPIARAVAERHNGRVELESSSEQGSVFSLWLPADPLKS